MKIWIFNIFCDQLNFGHAATSAQPAAAILDATILPLPLISQESRKFILILV